MDDESRLHACMKFYNETRMVYLETDASGIVVGSRLLQIRDGMTCLQDEAPHNSILRLIYLPAKALSNTEKRYGKIEKHWDTA